MHETKQTVELGIAYDNIVKSLNILRGTENMTHCHHVKVALQSLIRAEKYVKETQLKIQKHYAKNNTLSTPN